jgi:hypothetical protein
MRVTAGVVAPEGVAYPDYNQTAHRRGPFSRFFSGHSTSRTVHVKLQVVARAGDARVVVAYELLAPPLELHVGQRLELVDELMEVRLDDRLVLRRRRAICPSRITPFLSIL